MIDPETLAAENGFSHWAQMNMAAAVPMAPEFWWGSMRC